MPRSVLPLILSKRSLIPVPKDCCERAAPALRERCPRRPWTICAAVRKRDVQGRSNWLDRLLGHARPGRRPRKRGPGHEQNPDAPSSSPSRPRQSYKTAPWPQPRAYLPFNASSWGRHRFVLSGCVSWPPPLENIELPAHCEHLVMRIGFSHDGDVASAVGETFALVFGFFIDCIEDFLPSSTFGKCPSAPGIFGPARPVRCNF